MALPGVVVTEVQDLALELAELHPVGLVPSIQPMQVPQVPLRGLPALRNQAEVKRTLSACVDLPLYLRCRGHGAPLRLRRAEAAGSGLLWAAASADERSSLERSLRKHRWVHSTSCATAVH